MIDEFNDIRKDVLEYIDIKLDLIRLHTAENLSRIFSNIATKAVIGYLLFLIIIFLSFSAGFYLGSLFNSIELGFLSIAGLYIILLILFLIFRKKIIERPVIKAMVRLFFPKFEEDEKK